MDIKAYLLQLGYDEADATTFAADPKMSKAFEASAKQYEEGIAAREEAAKQKSDLDTWWKNTAQPAILNADSAGAQSKADAARYRAYLEDMKSKGYPVNDEWLGAAPKNDPPPANHSSSPQFDPQKFAIDQAEAMTMIYDLGNEYADLFGGPLPNAQGLFQEARQANRPLRDYVRSKFNFDGKRQERAEAKINERIEAARKEEREKAEAEAARRNNPLLAPAVTSRAAAVVEAQGDKADSWKTKQGRAEAKRDRLAEFRPREKQLFGTTTRVM